MLQMGTMVLSGVNLGVSIVGFAVVTHKINGLKKQLSSVEEKLDQIAARIEDLHHDQIANDFDALQVECQRVDEAFLLADPVAQWASAAGTLHHLEKRFQRRAQLLIEGSEINLMLLETFVEAFTLAGSTRTTARLASNDVEAARQSSITMSQTLAQLTGQFGAPDFLSEKLRGQELSPVKIRQEISSYRTEAETRAARLRDREEIAATTPLTLNQLRIEGISGRQWLEDLRSEETEPVALLIPLESK
jgi:chromosome segregation ATPase